jgi:hypothetical protein
LLFLTSRFWRGSRHGRIENAASISAANCPLGGSDQAHLRHVDTLRKHCEQELSFGALIYDADLRWTLHMRAVGGPKREWRLRPSPSPTAPSIGENL